MRKIAIVGVEGSGKTVMLAGLADLYSRPDDNGYFLAANDFNTSAYVAELMGRLRSGIWPAATADDAFQGLEWTLRRRSDTGGRPTDICELSCLDFPGEVYRKAFVDAKGERSAEMQRQIESLWNYIERADSLIVLVNLSDVISHGLADRRVHESIWVTSGILKEALKERPGRTIPKTAIVLSQTDNYQATIEACGGARKTLEKYLPDVYYSYDWLDIFAAYSIDKTRLDDDGKVVPDPSFTTEGLRPIMNWLLPGNALRNVAQVTERKMTKEKTRKITTTDDTVDSEKKPTHPVAGAPSGLGKHFTFQGRKNRTQYWCTILNAIGIIFFESIMWTVACSKNWLKLNSGSDVNDAILMAGVYIVGILPIFCAFCAFVASIVLRLHDFNRSGKWGLLCLLPVVGSILEGCSPTAAILILSGGLWAVPIPIGIILGIIPGTDGDNDYGPRP